MTGTCKKVSLLYLAALLSLGGLAIGCGDDDGGGGGGDTDAGTDAGTGMEDSGPEPDAGCTPMCEGLECGDDGCGGSCGECEAGLACNDDGTCPTTIFARLAHLMPNQGTVRVCAYLSAGGAPIGTPVGPLPPHAEGEAGEDGIPFRGVSSYTNLFSRQEGVTYTVKLYDATELDTADAGCPAVDATDPAPLAEGEITPDDLVVGEYYTIAAVGFVGDVSECGATFSDACADDQLAHVRLYDDDVTAPASGMTKLRWLLAVPNLVTPLGTTIDICWDPDLTDDTDTPVELFENVAYPNATDYLETDPIEAGGLTLHAHNPAATDANCLSDTQIGNPIPIPYPEATGVGTDAVPGSVAQFSDGSVATVFMSGNAASMDDTDPDRVIPIPFADVEYSE